MKPSCAATLALLVFTLIVVRQTEAQYYNQPESAAFDELRNCWYISNYGDGRIIRVDSTGAQTVFSDTLDRVAGLVILDNVLYGAASVSAFVGVTAIDLTSGQIVANIPTYGSVRVNDITADDSGYLYVTDSYEGKIHKVNLETEEAWIYCSSSVLGSNGIVYDAPNNRLLVSCMNTSGRPIKAVSLEDSLATVVVFTQLSVVDGLAFDEGHRLYFSAWQTNAVYRYGTTIANPPELISSGYDGPADIGINHRDHILAVPNFNRNTVDFISLTPDAVGEMALPERSELSRCYPNPFNARAVIEYTLLSPGDVQIDVYDALGRFQETLYSEMQTPGKHRAVWNAANRTSGIYFYTLQTDGRTETGKMILLK